MTPDEMCVEALRRKLITVDAEKGIAFAHRFWGKQLGSLSTKGYVVFTLHLDGHRKQIKMHRLIWISVHGVPPDGYVPDHENRIKTDNRIANLRLATQQQNSANRRSYAGEGNPSAKITREIAEHIRARHAVLRSGAKVADEVGVSKSLVAQIIRRELWT